MAGEGSLSVKTALAAKKVKGAWTINRLLYLLGELAKYDVRVVARRRQAGWVAIMALIACVATLIAGGLTETYFMSVLAFALIFVFVIAVISYHGYAKKDLPDDFREYLIPLLKLLSGDIRKKSKIALSMDIAQLQKQEYSNGVQTLPHSAPYYKITSERFERPLMTMAIRLRDGNRILMERSETLTVITKKKKNPRGKHKTKAKYKRMVSTRVRLAVNPRVYSVRKSAPDAGGGRVSVKTGRKRMALDLKFAEKGGLDVGMKPGPTISQIAVLYSCLVPAKR